MKLDRRVVWWLVQGAVVLAAVWLGRRREERAEWRAGCARPDDVPWVDVT